jgi:hypothetical protein
MTQVLVLPPAPGRGWEGAASFRGRLSQRWVLAKAWGTGEGQVHAKWRTNVFGVHFSVARKAGTAPCNQERRPRENAWLLVSRST